MNFFELIRTRQAVRKYKSKRKIPKNDIDKIIKAASLAPSAKNIQSYKLFVVLSNDSRQKVAESLFNQRSDFAYNASLFLIFCADETQSEKVFGERGRKLYSLQDATIAASFALLAVHELGYQSCWVGNFHEKVLKKILNTKLKPVAILVIGFGDEQPEMKKRKSIDDISQEV